MADDGQKHETTAAERGGWNDDELFARVPAREVPYEAPMARVARVVFAVQSVILLVVGIAGVVLRGGTFLGLRLNVPHAILLLVTAVAVGAAVFASGRVMRRVLLVQTVVYLIVAAFGLAVPTPLDLNVLDSMMHGVLFILGFTGVYIFAAGILEPGEVGSSPS